MTGLEVRGPAARPLPHESGEPGKNRTCFPGFAGQCFSGKLRAQSGGDRVGIEPTRLLVASESLRPSRSAAQMFMVLRSSLEASNLRRQLTRLTLFPLS